MTAWFISDLHLKNTQERSSEILLRFLIELIERNRPATHLFLVGDIFDIWAGGHEYYSKLYAPITDRLIELQKTGVEVHYFEGNHDMHMARFWQKHGVNVWVDPKIFQLGAQRVYIEHGDMINLNDLAYQRYRRFYRHPLTRLLIECVPPSWMHAFGRKFSQESRKHSAPQREDRSAELRDMIRSHAQKVRSVFEFDLMVTGHMHVQDDFKWNHQGQPCQSVNLGSWFDGAKALCVTSQGLELVILK